MNRICRIYTLSHPLTGEIRYIGKTVNELNKRLGQHIAYSKKGRNKNCCWIKSILKLGLKPIIELLDEVPEELTTITEQYWIAQFKCWNYRLTNYTDGGEGLSGTTLSEETKQLISKNRKGINPNFNILHTQKSKDRLSRLGKARIMSQETKNKIAETNRNKTHKIKVIDIDTNIIYNSIKEASVSLNINNATLKKRVKKNIGNIRKLED